MQTEIADDLQSYLFEMSAVKWIDGDKDCCTIAADWCVKRGYSDPMERWRGKYDTQEGAEAFIADYGGLVPLWLVGMADAGIEETSEPKAGDIGIVDIPMIGLVGAICAGDKWVMRSSDGLYCAKVKPEISWRIK